MPSSRAVTKTDQDRQEGDIGGELGRTDSKQESLRQKPSGTQNPQTDQEN